MSQDSDLGIYRPLMRDVAKYFMEFLETNFHRRRLPKRAIVNRNSQNLLIAVGLAKYPRYWSRIWGLLDDGSGLFTDVVEPGRFTRTVPEQTLRLLDQKAALLEEKTIADLHVAIGRAVDQAVAESSEDVEQAVDNARGAVAELIRVRLVAPFLVHVETTLESLAQNDIEIIHEAESSLTEVIGSQVDDVIGEAVRAGILEIEIEREDLLQQVCSVESCRESIRSFFSGLAVNDLAFDIQELYDNHRILDKQETYLNIGALTFEGRTYPLFYTPIRLEPASGRGFSLTADAPVYVNKKAIEYVVQQFNKQTGRRGGHDIAAERILYPGDLEGPLSQVLQETVDRLSDYFGLPESVDLRGGHAEPAKGLIVRISNSLYFTIFDKSDEALINDYEELLQMIENEDPIADSFGDLVKGFVTENPRSFRSETEDTWNDLSVADKAVYPTPVPLNAEQRKILMALRRPGCRYLSVEGPPGTGKSHTITALVCNAILEHKSVLILSDKGEALDVVEDKITDVLSQVRLKEENFQNPILRLGKTGSNFSKVLSKESIRKIGDHYRAVGSKEKQLTAQREQLVSDLKGDLDETILALGEVKLVEVRELLELREAIDNAEEPIDLRELLKASDPPVLEEIFNCTHRLVSAARGTVVRRLVDPEGRATADTIREALELLVSLEEHRNNHPDEVAALQVLASPDSNQLDSIDRIVSQYGVLTSGLFGALFKGKKIGQLNANLQTECRLSDAADLRRRSESYLLASSVMQKIGAQHGSNVSLSLLHQIAIRALPGLDELDPSESLDDLELLEDFSRTYPILCKSLELDANDLATLSNSRMVKSQRETVLHWDRRVALGRKIRSAFAEAPSLDYSSRLENLEWLKTHEMAHLLDRRVLQFAENERNIAQTLKGIIRKKQRFPRDLFSSLKEAFPCIIAGIRDYAEYIPLDRDLFDLVVIDEASQVSIAQAFPALLRARQVVVFGDRKQFSNVKSAHAKSEINVEWKKRIRDSFVDSAGSDPTHLERVGKFDIKTSILEFFDHICNFDIMLRKYFRGYPEHISYSSKFFYSGELQAIRLRTQSIDDTIRFSLIADDGKLDAVKNTNSAEAEFIVSRLVEMKEAGESRTVGIITPHTNQQKLIAGLVSSHVNRDFFINDLKLKVMTFDTCQGEERDVVFYSMVASARSDKLWAIFVKDLEKVDLEENGQVKAQRLNVGFSRAKECMHFVLSKGPEEFSGSIGQALCHYRSVLENAARLPEAEELDPRSPKEIEVLQWLKSTEFFAKNSSRLEVHAQFPLGETLKQIDPWYDHPKYKVDFLLVLGRPGADSEKIILEYDGFEFHFRDRDFVTDENFDQYYTEGHLERQLVLESYGYRFIRLNRFNCSDDPVRFLDSELERVVKKKHPMT